MTRLPRAVRIVLLALLAACGAPKAQPGATPATDFNLLTSADLADYGNAYQAIRVLRPGWLRTRAAGGLQGQGQVWVYRDGTQYGGLDRLSAMNTVEIDTIRYYDGITASQRWGLGHENGVIYVTSKNR